MADYARLHREAIIIDAVCPLIDGPQKLDHYREGGLTAVAPTVGALQEASATLRILGMWHKELRERDDLILVRRANDIVEAKRTGKLGLIMHFQGPWPVEDSLDLIDAFKALGVGIMQLAYNQKNRLGDGCEERTDAGLSRFGIQVVQRMNQARMIVDCSHTGIQTTMDALEYSSAPVIISHANAKSVYPSPRNISDEMIRAIAANGGTIGVVGFPGFVSGNKKPTIDQFIDHIAYMCDLVGADKITLGVDYYNGQFPYIDDETAKTRYEAALANGMWSAAAYPPPPHFYPAGIETPKTFIALTEALERRGFSEEDIKGIYGRNLLRLYEQIWGS